MLSTLWFNDKLYLPVKVEIDVLAELTAEERVTEILASYQVLKKQDNMSIVNKSESLGEFLQKSPKVDVLEEMNIKRVKPSDSRFAFVSTSWKI